LKNYYDCFNNNQYNVQNLYKVSMPKSTQSYKRHITDNINAKKDNKRVVVDLKFKNEDERYGYKWIIFIDHLEKHFIIVRWDGTKLTN